MACSVSVASVHARSWMLINLKLMANCCILLHINNMAKCTAVGDITAAVNIWERGFLYTSLCDISQHWRRIEGINLNVLAAGREINCEIRFLSFTSSCYSAWRCSTVTMLFLDCAVNNTKTLSTSLAVDGFISQYKLIISLRSWKVILTKTKLCFEQNPVIPGGG